MSLLEYYNKNIIQGFDKYHVQDLNIENAKVVFLLESGHKDEVKNKMPLCGTSGSNFSEKLFDCKIAFGLWKERPKTIGILESSPFPLQKLTYEEYFEEEDYPVNKKNINQISCFEELRRIVYDINPEQRRDLINYVQLLPNEIVETKLYKDYANRIDRLFSNKKVETIVVCGIFAQRFFNSYLSQHKLDISKITSYGSKPNTGIIEKRNIRIIYINHPKDWKGDDYSKFMENTVQEIKKIISSMSNSI